jgi:hypothetical protein
LFDTEIHGLLRSISFAVGIVTIGSPAEANTSFISLVGIAIELGQTGKTAGHEGKYTGRHGIEGTQMADRLFADDAAHARNHVVRSHALRLVYD